VRGTVYRVNVYGDDSAMVKVYDGAVEVNGSAKQVSGTTSSSGPPAVVSGPQPVAGPHPVSMEQWVYTLKAMQQIIIRPDGTASPPFRFSYEADRNNWVEWNRQRDAAVGMPVPEAPVDGPADTPPKAVETEPAAPPVSP